MKCKVNGEWKQYPDGSSVEYLLDLEGIERKYMAVELNRRVLRKTLFSETILEDGDTLEIVKLVGGG